ncbi:MULTISPECIES: hypothetical protein [unclassified Streptomyces]|uniref:hypothetical protein n=1 Tax=unclassified Streptomyces TaxID=2593676 RepID=UPI00344CF360
MQIRLPGPSPADRQLWRATTTLSDLAELTARWLEGIPLLPREIRVSPHPRSHQDLPHPPPDGSGVVTGLASLTWLIGTQALSAPITARVNELVEAGTEYATACAKVTDASEAWAIAATRQTWVRQHDVDPDEMPVRSLYVLELVAYIDLDQASDADGGDHSNVPPEKADESDHPQGIEHPFELLERSFELAAWEPFGRLLPTVAVPAAGSTGAEE